jgi:hypothetical protein
LLGERTLDKYMGDGLNFLTRNDFVQGSPVFSTVE